MDTWLHTAMEIVLLLNGLISVPIGIVRICRIEKHLRKSSEAMDSRRKRHQDGFVR